MLVLCPVPPLRLDTGCQTHSHPNDLVLPGNTELDPDATSYQTNVWPSPELFTVLSTRSDVYSFTLLPVGILTLVPSLLPLPGLLGAQFLAPGPLPASCLNRASYNPF